MEDFVSCNPYHI